MEYTRNGKKISAEEFNRIKSGNIMPGGGKPGGFLGGMMEERKICLVVCLNLVKLKPYSRMEI